LLTTTTEEKEERGSTFVGALERFIAILKRVRNGAVRGKGAYLEDAGAVWQFERHGLTSAEGWKDSRSTQLFSDTRNFNCIQSIQACGSLRNLQIFCFSEAATHASRT
jgi:hypothetical protein